MLGKARFAHIKALAAALLDTLNLEPNVGVVHKLGHEDHTSPSQ